MGDPIYPLTGANTQPVDTGFSVGTESLKLTYDTARQLSGLTSGNLPSFGSLWVGNLHRNLSISTGATAIKAYRGNGGMVTFVLKAGVYTPDGDVNDRIAAVSGGYAYTDAAERKVELYNSTGQLASITDSSGRTLSFSYSTSETATAPAAGYLMQVVANTGRLLKFEYELAPGANAVLHGRIAKITEAGGAFISVAYDTNGNLSTITWPDGKVRRFLYENSALPWALTGVIDENNSRFLTFAYDSQGRAISSEQAGGVDRYSVSYASPPTRTITEVLDPVAKIKYRYHEIQPPTSVSLTQPMGQNVSWSASSAVGAPVITGASQPAGSGCAAANNASVYDVNGNVLSHDNFKGERSCYAYDGSNRQTARVDGLATTVDCASVLPTGAALPLGSRKTLTQWHPDWRLESQVSTADSVSTTVFNGQVDPSNGLPLSCSSVPSLPTGKPVPLVCKRSIRSTTDSSTRTSLFTYNDAGYMLTAHDSLGHQSIYQYANTNNSALDDAFDRVQILLHGDGVNGAALFVDNSSPAKTVSVAYGTPSTSQTKSKFGGSSMYFPGDASVAVAGVSGTTFWASDWTVEFWAATDVPAQGVGAVFGNRDNSGLGMGGGQLYLSYSAGLLTGITFELGESSTWAGFGVGVSTPGFFAARVASGFDHVAVTKQGLVYTFFLNGVKLNSITRSAAAMNSPSAVLYVGAANKHQFYPYYFKGYVDDFRVTMGAARYLNGFVPRTTAFPNAGYPPDADLALYNLQSITNAAGHVTQYTQYDRAGRVRQMIDPKGVVTDTTYTPRGWISSTTVTPPGGVARTTTYTYDNVGQLTGVVMPDATTLTYSYDAAHRLTGVTDTKGNTVTYTLDNMGNKVGEQVKDPQGNLQRNITRLYDSLNRVQQITGAEK